MKWLQQKIRKRFKGLRTLIINLLLTILPVLEMSEILNVMPDGWQSSYILIMALINLYLRTITTTPIGKDL